jgi:hypothetical protein
VKGVKSPFHQKVKTNFKKIFTQGEYFAFSGNLPYGGRKQKTPFTPV